MRFVVADTKGMAPGELRRLLEQHGYRVLAVEDDPRSDAPQQEAADTAVIDVESVPERPAGEPALTDSDERLRTAVAVAKVGTWHWDLTGGELLWSPGCAEIFGKPAETRSLSYEQFVAAIHPGDRERVRKIVQHMLEDGGEMESEYRVLLPDGAVRSVFARGGIIRDESGRPLRVEGVVVDLTAQRQAETALFESERRFRELADALPHLLWQVDAAGELVYSNRKHREFFGTDRLTQEEWERVLHPDEHSWHLDLFARVASTLEQVGPFVHRLRARDGTYTWFASHVVPVANERGQLEYMIGTSTDVSALKQAEQELRDTEDRLMTALQAAGMGTWRYDPVAGTMEFDDALLALHGYTREDGRVFSADVAMLMIHQDDRELSLRTMGESIERESDFMLEVRALKKSGEPFWIRTRGRVQRDGETLKVIGASVDITRQKALEEQLRQAQKMEAIGQLAGGVAHDFNNMLTIIAGRVSLMKLSPKRSDDMEESLRDISLATERAASLTAQLLAFARRQVLRPRDLDLNQIVANVVRMLARTLGEHIEFEFKPLDRPVVIQADEGMITQVLLNLAVNARDAMPRGGTLTVSTTIVPGEAASGESEASGPLAQLEVKDTGEGMTPAVLEHVFEPFFTTKPVGKGTGLGLATVYGIVMQHRGSITVDSAPGAGATFRIRFPLGSAPPAATSAPEPPTRGRGETVLLVEDEPSVCRLVKRLLEAHGYRVIAVDTGMAAISAFEASDRQVDLLFTDMVLRGNMTGRELLERLRAERPSLRALLTSGYSLELTAEQKGPVQTVPFLRKPFNAEELLRAVREALARTPQR